MANRTDVLAKAVHGTDPQNLIPNILRQRIYANQYWKEQCFGLNSATVIDKAVALDYVGGTYSQNSKPTPFLCLLLKLLQIQPAKEIIAEFLKQEQHKYLRALACFYMRLTGRAAEVYSRLEPLLVDYRKLAVRSPSGWGVTHMDAYVDELLREDTVMEVTLPKLQRRSVLEATGQLEPRSSPLEEELREMAEADDAKAEAGHDRNKAKPGQPQPPSSSSSSSSLASSSSASAAPTVAPALESAGRGEQSRSDHRPLPAPREAMATATSVSGRDDDSRGGASNAAAHGYPHPHLRDDRHHHHHRYRDDRPAPAPDRRYNDRGSLSRDDGYRDRDRHDYDRYRDHRDYRDRDRGDSLRRDRRDGGADRDRSGDYRDRDYRDHRDGRGYAGDNNGHYSSSRRERSRSRSGERGAYKDRDRDSYRDRDGDRDGDREREREPPRAGSGAGNSAFNSSSRPSAGTGTSVLAASLKGGGAGSGAAAAGRAASGSGSEVLVEGSVEWWNRERAKLGLKPLKG